VELDSILRHAITPPSLDRSKIHRERLVDTLHANIPRKLIAIAAPPGYGKTTLLADFTQHTELPVCWVRLTEADRDVMRLAAVMAASLKRRFRRLRGDLDMDLLAGTPPAALGRHFAAVIDEKISEPFVIIFDDVHLINNAKPPLEFLDAFLEVLPEQVTVIASGREVLEVSLARLMAEGDLAGMGPHDLALTRDELVLLFSKQMEGDLDDREIDRLLDDTRGWITGVLLSGMLSRSTMNSLLQSSGPMVYDYLASVVFNRQSDAMRNFMLESAVLPVMTAEACDEVLRRDDSGRFLRRLVRSGLFITAAGEGPRMYEYHPQFREFLLSILEDLDPRRLRSLRMRAARYLEGQGAAEHAVELYFEARAETRAAALADRQAARMFRAGRTLTLKEWAVRFESAKVNAPKLFLFLSKALTDQGNTEEAMKALARARAMIDPKTQKALAVEIACQEGFIAYARGDTEKLVKVLHGIKQIMPKRLSKIARVLYYRVQAMAVARLEMDYARAEQLVQKAIALLEDEEHRYLVAASLIDLSAWQTSLGKTDEAHANSLKAHQALMEIGAPLPLASSYNNLAVTAHIQGRYEEALHLFSEGVKCARQAGSLAREALILLGQADLFNDLGLALQAAELYGQGLRLATRAENKVLIRYGCLMTAVLHRRRGTGDLPHQWLQRAIAVGEGQAETPEIRIQMAALELRVEPERAEASLRTLLEDPDARLNAELRALALYFHTKALYRLGRGDEAHAGLQQLLDWVGARGLEQVVAAEFAADEPFREFARKMVVGPVMGVILQRIDTMKALAQRYQEDEEEASLPTRMRVRALGVAEIGRGENSADGLKPLAREVLFYLVEHRRVERDVLLETFWPHYPPGRQVSNLYTAIYSLRRSLGKDTVVLDGSVYGLNPELTLEYDVERFERAAAVAEGLLTGDPRRFFALTEAINSYGGRFLPEFSSDWVMERRRDLELRFLELLIAHAQEAMVRNQPARAVSSLRRALAIDPYRDDINSLYLEALGMLERRSEIVAHYQQYVQLLANELGLDPPDAVRELYGRLIG
jgi:ATP/maltotriose-dependent transcriptional regulator MalT/DNA-binding SARP family transcriptional activator